MTEQNTLTAKDRAEPDALAVFARLRYEIDRLFPFHGRMLKGSN